MASNILVFILFVAVCSGCSQEPPTAQVPALVSTSNNTEPSSGKPSPPKTLLESTTVTQGEARTWSSKKLSNSRQIVADGSGSIRPIDEDRAIIRAGNRSILIDHDAEVLGSFEGFLYAEHRETNPHYGTIGKEMIVDLRTGEKQPVTITNAGDIPERTITELKITGRDIWWLSRSFYSGDMWIAKIEWGQPATAKPVATPATPSLNRVGYYKEKNWLLFEREGVNQNSPESDCPMMVFNGTDEMRCLEVAPTFDWRIHGDRLVQLSSYKDSTIDLKTLKTNPFPTEDCDPYLKSLHEESGSVFFTCRGSGRSGILTGDNRVHYVETRGSYYPPRGTTNRFVRFSFDTTPSIILDMHGGDIEVPGQVVAVGINYALARDGDQLNLVDLVGKKLEPFDKVQCDQELSVVHTTGDRFIVRCLEYDPSSIAGRKFGCGTARSRAKRYIIRSQELVDVGRLTRFSFPDVSVEATTGGAVLARTGAKKNYVDHGGPEVLAFTLP